MLTPPLLDGSESASTPSAGRPDVARIRAAIAAGTYRVDPERLAEALIAAGVVDAKRTR